MRCIVSSDLHINMVFMFVGTKDASFPSASGPWWLLLDRSGLENSLIYQQENSPELFRWSLMGQRSVSGHSSRVLGNLLVSEAISDGLESTWSFAYRRQTGFVSGGLRGNDVCGEPGRL